MRHIHEISSIAQLDYPDSFSIQAIGDEGSILWKRRFPHLVIQSYYASNDSFILIKNSRTITNTPSSYMEGVHLISTGEEEVENHILLALLHSPQSTPQIPLLDHVEQLPYPSSPIWPVIQRNKTINLHFHNHTHVTNTLSTTEQLFVFVFISVFIFIMYYLFKWVESLYADPDEFTQTPNDETLQGFDLNIPYANGLPQGVAEPITGHLGDAFSISTDKGPSQEVTPHPEDDIVLKTTTTDLTHFSFVPLKGYNLPLRTGLYKQEFIVCFYYPRDYL